MLTENGVKELLYLLPSKNNENVKNWLNGMMDPLDEQSKRKAYEIFEGDILNNIEVGTFKGLQQIHSYLFGGLYDFSGKMRNKNISKGGFIFANCNYLLDTLNKINNMKDETLEEIVDKYIEMNLAHPFMEGNGRSTRIWLDLILKKNLSLCVDWSAIDKKSYLAAMERSPIDASPIRDLISSSLTNKIADREVFMKGIDYSYYYEEEN